MMELRNFPFEVIMADISVLIQFSVFLVNKPGVLAQVTGALASEKVNLIAVTLVDSQEHGVLRMVAETAGRCPAGADEAQLTVD